ncbi:MAG: low specificity L-threonine aldolase [Proteobacteria bacterium]|nr:low specificity L-threonine aldolase [Pseudomonadota bacterium]
MRYDFVSDNTAGLAPEALDALIRANDGGFVRSYGADPVSARCADLIREKLEADAEIRFVFNGTAANALALSMIARPFEAVLTHGHAHICTDEAGAPGLFGHGVGLIKLGGRSGRIEPGEAAAALAEPWAGYIQPPAALSVTQATEYGAVYTEEELRKLIEPCKLAGLKAHVDGARLANAVAAGFDPKDIPRLGVDVLVLGAAKAGAAGVEALVVFDKSLSRHIDNRLKQAGQVGSKARFMAAPLLGLLESGAWEGHAAHANRMAQRLAEAVRTRTPWPLAHPVQANLVFVSMPPEARDRLAALGWAAYEFSDGSTRFVCSWATTEAMVDEFAEALAKAA